MDVKLAYWGSVIFSGIALILLIVNITFSNANRTLQLDVNQRQSLIAEGQTFNQVNQGLIQALAEAAFKNNNVQLRDLLAAQGITVKAAEPSKPETSVPEKK